MADSCGAYVSADDLKAAKESILHIEHVATSKDASGSPALVVTDPIRGVGYTNATLDGLFSDIGFKPVNGSFEDGGTLNNRWEVLLYEADGSFYQWTGSLPKVVPAGSTPTSAGGIGPGAWVDQSDLTLRNEIMNGDGSFIGTNHRGDLKLDLDAIDRRPDGYSGGIVEVLTNGNDVEINKDITSSDYISPAAFQHIKGAGGTFTQTTSTSAGMRIEGINTTDTKDYVTVSDFRSTGSALSTEPGNQAYAVLAYKVKYLKITGILAQIYTGALAIGQAKSSIVRDVIAHDTTFHPLNPSTRDGRGGYGVITDNIQDSLIDGVILDVGAVDNGRHVLYVSTGGYGDTSGNRNFIATNLIGKYLGKDDRNFWGINVRKSTIFNMGSIVVDGANGGVAFNPQEGEISDFILHDVQLDIIKYQDGVGVYGITTQNQSGVTCSRFLITNFNIRVRPKNTSLSGADCVGISLSYQDGMINNGVISTPSAASPILVNDGANNTTISNVHDNSIPGYSGTTGAMITFTGSAVSNIKVSGIKTSRPMFARLFVVTDLTVDFQRKARVATNGSGGTNLIDSNSIIGSVTLTSSAITVNFPTHVTQAAVENVQVAGTAGAYQTFITSIGAKTINIALYTPSGALINPQTTSAALNIILSS